MEHEIITINTDYLESALAGKTLIETRMIAYKGYQNQNTAKILIFLMAYNRLEKTKKCVESILRNTTEFDYELILVDNGSSDGTLEYFKTVSYPKTVIWRITKNIGANYPISLIMQQFQSKYLVHIANDTYVTKNWLSNLLRCYESDDRIGLAVPVSSNISNLQEVDLHIQNFEDMQKKAEVFNQPDPRKWQERLRLMPLITILRRDICDVAGTLDLGFYHDFADDDLSARIRHAGYKLILCGDTYVYHDHDFRNMEDKDPVQFQHTLELGRKIYQEKYQGIDAWDDINNYELPMMQLLEQEKNYPAQPQILCVDPRCGTPVLQIRNMLRTKGIMDSISNAFTTKAKYFYDLQLVTQGRTICDRIDFLMEHYREDSFDIILLGEPVNTYPEPVRLTEHLLRCVRKGGKPIYETLDGYFITGSKTLVEFIAR